MKSNIKIPFGFILFAYAIVCHAQHISTNIVTAPQSFNDTLPSSVNSLFAWPRQEVLSGAKSVNFRPQEIGYARTECLEWIEKALNKDWCPSANAEIFYLKEEFKDHDVVRLTWNSHGFCLEASQTASLFALRLIPTNHQSLGNDMNQRMQEVKNLSVQLFKKTGTFYDSRQKQIPRQTLTNLSSLIGSWSFENSQTKASLDGTVFRELQPGKERFKEEKSETPWIMTVESYEYWFRNIYWWNNGSQIGFYFPKTEGYGAKFIPLAGFVIFDNSFDKNFFRDSK